MRRLRGILVSMLLWAVPWALVGLTIGLFLVRMDNVDVDITVWPDAGRFGVPTLLMLTGATIGAVNGLVFALLVVAAERNRSIESLHVGRFGAWGALASGGIATLAVGLNVIALGAAAIGFGAAASMASLARRGARSDDAHLLAPPRR